MTISSIAGTGRWVRWMVWLLAVGLWTGDAQAGDLEVQAQLIWGTDEAKPAGKELKDIDPKLRDKLKGIFKWKNYFEVNRTKLQLPLGGSKKTRMSERCEVQIDRLESDMVEMKLFGQGKLVGKMRQKISPGEFLVIAGDDKRENAWFVVVTQSKP